MVTAFRSFMFSPSGEPPVPPEFVELDHITVDASKSQYVNTGIVASHLTHIEVKFRVECDASVKPNYCVAGGRYSYNGPTFMIWGSTATARAPRFDMHPTVGNPTVANGCVVNGFPDTMESARVAVKKGASNWDGGTQLSDNAYPDADSGCEIYFMAGNEKNAVKCPMGGDVYYFKSYDADGNLAMHLVPVRKASDNGIYFYDKVSGAYYGNAGTQNPIDAVGSDETTG